MSYYYLISGLPDLEVDTIPAKIDFEETLDTIERNLEEVDKELFRYLIYPNDNRNFLNVLFHEFKDFPMNPLVRPSVLPANIIKGYRRMRGSLPQYMSEFLSEHEDHLATMTMTDMEEKLMEKFQAQLNDTDNSFIIDYFTFEYQLKNAVAAYNLSHFDFLPKPPTSVDNIFYQLGKNKSIPPFLQQQYPFLEELAEITEDLIPNNIERFIDRIKWDYLSNLVGFFQREHVFAYTLKLLLVWRWQQLKVEQDEPHFEKLTERIKASIPSPKITLT
jgi:hypothetical protein